MHPALLILPCTLAVSLAFMLPIGILNRILKNKIFFTSIVFKQHHQMQSFLPVELFVLLIWYRISINKNLKIYFACLD